MITRSKIESQMLDMYVRHDRAGLDNLISEMTQKIKTLDAWFDKYLDMFDSQMDSDNPNTPVWALYNKKFGEYNNINSCLTSLKHYRSKI